MNTRLFAVLVGIDGYAPLDASQGAPTGTSDNQGAVFDAFDWFLLLRRLDVPRGDMMLLAARGVDTRDDFPGAEHLMRRAGASKAEILAAARWLDARLTEHPNARGLFLFSGHAEAEDDGVRLLAADAAWKGGTLSGGVSTRELVAALGGERHRAQLTMVLDACHAGAAGREGGDRVRRPLRRAPARRGTYGELPFRTIVACRPEERSYELPVGRAWRGAFSWACLRVIQRWGNGGPHESPENRGRIPVAEGEAPTKSGASRGYPGSAEGFSAASGGRQGTGVELSYDELITRTNAVLAAMGVDQHAAYIGPAGLAKAGLLLRRPPEGGPAVLGDKEIDAGTCDIIARDGTPLGTLYASPVTALDAWPDEWVCWWTTGGGSNPFLARDHFDLVRTLATPGPPPGGVWMVHPNGVFTGWPPGSTLPDCTRWYRWARKLASGAIHHLGWIGVKPAPPGGTWTLAWLSIGTMSGRAKLVPGERFLLDLVPASEITGVQAASIDQFVM